MVLEALGEYKTRRNVASYMRDTLNNMTNVEEDAYNKGTSLGRARCTCKIGCRLGKVTCRR